MKKTHFRKDASLDQLADVINVAQFVSYSPAARPRQEFSRVLGYAPNFAFENSKQAVKALFDQSPEGSLNVRSFAPDDPRSHEFLYGLTSIDQVLSALDRISASGLHVIVNETIDVNDGGVSGVVQGGVIEFSPDDTPRCVEKPGVTSLPERWGRAILSTTYGFALEFPVNREDRLEFTLHPRPRGWKHTHVLGWELERVGPNSLEPIVGWPSNFSRMIGDKAFGLLLASAVGLPTPRTTVLSRRIAPFHFGDETGSNEWWIRTCPREQMPGKYSTHHGWLDPFKLLAHEDPEGSDIASVLAQRAVPARYSGALIVGADGAVIVEGKQGEGEAFMKGEAHAEALPAEILNSVSELYQRAHALFGPVRFEWVHDGHKPWIVQLHKGATLGIGSILVPGEALTWHAFEVSLGLERLREFLAQLPRGEGIELTGQVGLTSHVADVVRKTGKPARLAGRM